MSPDGTNRQLPDGTRLLVREVRPSDRALFALGFQHFGPASRYQRFLRVKAELTESELSYLTEVDGSKHFAIGAVMFDERGVAQPVGIARFVRLEAGGKIAEPAVAVVDPMQGKGVGKLLLRELSDAAYARGVRQFRCRVLASNGPIGAVLDELGPMVRLIGREGEVDEIEIDVPAPEPNHDALRKGLLHLLRLAASKLVAWVPSKPR